MSTTPEQIEALRADVEARLRVVEADLARWPGLESVEARDAALRVALLAQSRRRCVSAIGDLRAALERQLDSLAEYESQGAEWPPLSVRESLARSIEAQCSLIESTASIAAAIGAMIKEATA